MLKIWFISVDENIFVYFLQQFVKITLNGIVVIMPGSKIQALKTFVIPISMSSSINRRKMLTLPFWRAKQKVTTFQTSPLCSACRNIPLLWKRYVSINQTAGKCCHFLFGERNRVPKFWTSPLCLASRETPFLWKRHGSINKRQANAVTSCLAS